MAARRSPSAVGRLVRVVVAAALLVGVTGIPGLAGAAIVPRGVGLVSVSLDGTTDPAYSGVAEISDDGRYVVFESSNFLTADDADSGSSDVFLRDTLLGTTSIVSIPVADDNSYNPRISDDGRYVSFATSFDIDPADTNGGEDIYVRDMQLAWDAPGAYTWVDCSANYGVDGDYQLSGNASTIVFSTSLALDPGDLYSMNDVYAMDVASGACTWVSADTVYTDNNTKGSRLPRVTDDGRFVAFLSGKDLTVDDPDSWTSYDVDFFIRDLLTGDVLRLPVRSALDGWTGSQIEEMEFSGDGSAVVFQTEASFNPGYYRHIYHYDVLTGTVSPVSVAANWYGARDPQVSDDGDTVMLFTRGPLCPEDTDGEGSIYLYDAPSGVYTVLGTGMIGDNWSNGWSGEFEMSGDGQYVTFESDRSISGSDDNAGQRDVYITALPVSADDTYTTNEDTPLVELGGVLLNDGTFPAGVTLTTSVVGDVVNGALVLNGDGTFTYTPNANWNGTETFTYQVDDGYSLWAPATVTINVVAVDDPTVAVDDATSTNEDNAVTVTVLANDVEVDGDPLTVIKVADPANGGVVVNADNTITYTPNANWNGVDSFTYKVNDGTSDSNVATVDITVNAVNDAPVAGADSATTDEDNAVTFAVLGNDTDVEGDPLTVIKVTDPANGAVVLNADDTFTYTPNSNWNGADSFTYKVNDGTSDSNVATVDITVNAVDDPTVAVDDAASTNEDNAVTVAVLANDVEVDGDPLTVIKVTGPANGAVVLNPDSTFTYTPNANWNGADSFTYKVNDGTSDSNVATVDITVNAVNDAPVAGDDIYSVPGNQVLTVAAPGILANDSDVEGSALSITRLTDPAHGVLTLNANGSFTYTPGAGFSGLDSFTYKVNDGTYDSNVATVKISVTQTSTVYRFYNARNGSHFYTDSASERDAVINNYWGIYRYEGPAFASNPTDKRVHRFYNRLNNTHFYTASDAEKNRVLALYSSIYTYEGLSFAVSVTAAPGYVPVYRFYNVMNGSHFYTSSDLEKAIVIAKWPGVYRYEGLAFYVLPGVTP